MAPDEQAAAPVDEQGVFATSVNLTSKSIRAMEDAAYLTGDSKTDTVNRALQVYLILVQAAQEDGPAVATGLRGVGAYDLYITRFLRR